MILGFERATWGTRLATGWLAAVVLLAWIVGLDGYQALRERATDGVLAAGFATAAGASGVLVVDIDRESLAGADGWPWSRTLLAKLIDRIADARPAAIGIDILLQGEDGQSPAALARRLALATGEAGYGALATVLEDADKDLARALARVPSSIGLVLDDGRPLGRGAMAAPVPVLLSGEALPRDIWRSDGAALPLAQFADAAAGVGALSLAADNDGRVRRVPLLVAIGDVPAPGLALDVARIAEGASAVIVTDAPARVATGGQSVPLGDDGMVRLVPRDGNQRRQRTISAASVMTDPAVGARLAGRIVLVGSSAPEAGGLRVVAGADLVASVHLVADAVEQIFAGLVFGRPVWLTSAEVGWAATAAAAAGLIGFSVAPVIAAAAALAVALLAALPGMIAMLWGHIAADCGLAPMAAMVAFAGASLVRGFESWRRAALLRGRLEQQLPGEIIRRLLDDGGGLRLATETREVTILISDIEDFTAMVERHAPDAVVDALDRYFEIATRIVERHGGIVDKFVGDSVHAMFNAPLDLPEHPRSALACAQDLQRAMAEFAVEADIARLGFGRTRIGIETGEVIVGDVGGRRLDYTAYGTAINTAARLEAANKVFGSCVCIGAEAAARLPAGDLRPLGRLQPRGRSVAMTVYEPWPDDFDAADRQQYLSAYVAETAGEDRARHLYEDMAMRRPNDRVLASACRRLSG